MEQNELLLEHEKNKELFDNSKLVDPIFDPSLFEDNEALDYECVICKNIPNPHQCYEAICCGHLFCIPCINNWLKGSKKCPLCNVLMKSDQNYLRNIETDSKFIYKMMLKLKLRCPYNCEWAGPFGELDDHLKVCDYKTYKCKYNNLGCKFIGRKDKCEEHEKHNDEDHLKIAMDYIERNFYLTKTVKFDLDQFCKVSCHPHLLRYMRSYPWVCDGRDFEGGCLSPYEHFNAAYRFRCQQCDFDLCPYCLLKYCTVENQ